MTNIPDPVSEARALARALHNTNQAYQGGFMSRGTWQSHMSSLWGRAAHFGIRDNVMAELDKLKRGTGFLHAFRTPAGLPPDSADQPVCGASLPADYSGAGLPRCPDCEKEFEKELTSRPTLAIVRSLKAGKDSTPEGE